MTKDEWKELRYFKSWDLFKRGNITVPSFPFPDRMDFEFMSMLDEARHIAGIPFIITCSVRNDSPSHLIGVAVDIRGHGNEVRYKIVKALDQVGIYRIGIYDKHVHGDIHPTLPRGIWGGVSD